MTGSNVYPLHGNQTELSCAGCDRLTMLLRESERNARDADIRYAEQIEGLKSTIHSQSGKIGALRNELRKEEDDDDDKIDRSENREIKRVLEHWKRVCGWGKGTKTDLASDRAALVRKQLKRYSADQLIEAIDGLAIVPYVVNKKRAMHGTKAQRFNKIEHAIGNDNRISNMRDIAQRARAASEEYRDAGMWEEYWFKHAELQHLMDILTMHAIHEEAEAEDVARIAAEAKADLEVAA